MKPDNDWIDPALVWDAEDIARRLAALEAALLADGKDTE